MTLNPLNQVTSEQNPLISVIIPIFNGEADLPQLLACLAEQTYPSVQIEYLLVDNGSSDQTAELLHEAIAVLTLVGCRVLTLQETTIQSAYAARNLGIKASLGELLVFTDVDCRPQPNWLEQLVVPLKDSAVGIVAGEVSALPGNSALERHAQRHAVLSQRHTLTHPYRPYGQTANLAVRRRVFEQIGLFRPFLTSGGDADLCWRSQNEGWQIQFAEQAIVLHRHRSTWQGLWQQWQRYGQSSRYLHDLYEVALMRELSLPEYFHRLSRWLLKEVPTTVRTLITQQEDSSLVWDTPIDLWCRAARSQGQRNAHLPVKAEWIDWLSPPPKSKDS